MRKRGSDVDKHKANQSEPLREAMVRHKLMEAVQRRSPRPSHLLKCSLTCPRTATLSGSVALHAVWKLYCWEAVSVDGRVAVLTGVTGLALWGEAANNSDRSVPQQRVLGEMSGCRSYWWKDEADRPQRMMLTGVPCLFHLASLSPSIFPPSFYLPLNLHGTQTMICLLNLW